MPMLMKYEHLCFYLIPSANRGTNKGFLDSCHYNFPYKNVITIHFIGNCHYNSTYLSSMPSSTLATTWAHCQGPNLRIGPYCPSSILRQRREAAPT